MFELKEILYSYNIALLVLLLFINIILKYENCNLFIFILIARHYFQYYKMLLLVVYTSW